MRMKKGLIIGLLLTLLASPSFSQIVDETGATGAFTPDRSATGTLGALDAAVTIRMNGRTSVGTFQDMATGSFNGTVVAEMSVNGGVNWTLTSFVDADGIPFPTLIHGGAGTWTSGILVTGGVTHVRVRVSAYTSGTLPTTLKSTAGIGPMALAAPQTLFVKGARSHNGAAPTIATNLGVLPAIANAAAPTFTEGRQVLLSTDLSGALRVSGGGGGTQYAEDTAHASGDQLNMAGVVQQSADAALSSDNDRSVLQVDSSGFLKVNVKAGAGSGGTAMTDDAAYTVAVTNFTPAGGTYRSALDSVDDGDGGAFAMTSTRSLYSNLRNDAGAEVGITASPLKVQICDGADCGGVSAGSRMEVATQAEAVDGAAGTAGALIHAIRNDAAPSTLAEDTRGYVRNTAERGLHTNLRDAAGAELGTAASPLNVQGAKTSNGAVPGATNVGTLPGVATAAAPSYTEGRMVALSTDLTGALRTTSSGGSGGTSAVDNSAFTHGTTAVTPMGAIVDEVPTLSTPENSVGIPRMTANRVLEVNLRTNGGTELATAASFPAGTETALLTRPIFTARSGVISAVSVGTSSTSVLAANASRKGAVFTNTSTAIISCALAEPAVNNSGIVLYPAGVWQMDEFTFTKDEVRCIASAAASNLAIITLQ